MLARARASLDALLARASAVSEHTDVYDLEPGHTPQNPQMRCIELPHTHTPIFWELAQYPSLVGMLEKLLGPSGARLHGSKIKLKEPHHGPPVERHQDWAFYPHTIDDLLAVGVMLTTPRGKTDCFWSCRARTRDRSGIIIRPTVCSAVPWTQPETKWISAALCH